MDNIKGFPRAQRAASAERGCTSHRRGRHTGHTGPPVRHPYTTDTPHGNTHWTNRNRWPNIESNAVPTPIRTKRARSGISTGHTGRPSE